MMETKSLTPGRRPVRPTGQSTPSRDHDPTVHPVLSDALSRKYSASLFFFAIGIVTLGILDAYWTLILLNTGSVVELNPIMRAFIEHDIRLFLIAKASITGISVVALVACTGVPQLSRLNAMFVIQGLFVIYVLLICYESQLLYRLM